MADLQNVVIDNGGFLEVPKGTCAQRPSNPSLGDFRYNTELKIYEYYNGNSWVDIRNNKAEIVQEGLIFSFDFDDKKGYFSGTSTVDDQSTNLVTGSVVGNRTKTSRYKGGLNFDGTNDYITIPYSSDLMDFSLGQTICMWFRPGEDAQDSRKNPYNQAYGGEGTITHEQNGSINYFFGTSGQDSSPYVGRRSQTFTVEPSELAFIAVTRDQTTNQAIWYKNGIQDQIQNAGGYASTAPSNKPILIGEGYTNHFSGEIYEIHVYNRALNQGEIVQNYLSNIERYTQDYDIVVGPVAIQASGGSSTVSDGGYRYHYFTTNDTFTVTSVDTSIYPTGGFPAEVLVVAGGGGSESTSGARFSGGGGAGGYQATTLTFAQGNYPVVVGAGGAGQSSGTDSSILHGGGTETVPGGGRGGYSQAWNSGLEAEDGGSGGGGRSSYNGPHPAGIAVNAGVYGNNGGSGADYNFSTRKYTAGGGGGAGAPGQGAQPDRAGDGGDGLTWLNGAAYAGGGAGGCYWENRLGGNSTTPADGGLGGGGNGGLYDQDNILRANANNGVVNTGGGAGGGTSIRQGGSGIVIVRYPI